MGTAVDGAMSGRSLARHQAWLAARTRPVLELRGDLSVGERVKAVVKFMTENSVGGTGV